MLSGFTRVQLFATLRTAALQAPLSMGFSSKKTGVGCHALLQGVFPTQGLNPRLLRLLHCRQILYCLSYEGSKMAGSNESGKEGNAEEREE